MGDENAGFLKALVKQLMGMRHGHSVFSFVVLGLVLLLFRYLACDDLTTGFRQYLTAGLVVYALGVSLIAHLETMAIDNEKYRWKARTLSGSGNTDRPSDETSAKPDEIADKCKECKNIMNRWPGPDRCMVCWMRTVLVLWSVLFVVYLAYRLCL